MDGYDNTVIDLLTIPGVVGFTSDPDGPSLELRVVQEFAENPYRLLELQRLAARSGEWAEVRVTT